MVVVLKQCNSGVLWQTGSCPVLKSEASNGVAQWKLQCLCFSTWDCVRGESAEERSIGVALFHMARLCFRNQLCCNSTAWAGDFSSLYRLWWLYWRVGPLWTVPISIPLLHQSKNSPGTVARKYVCVPYVSVGIHVCTQNETRVVLRVQVLYVYLMYILQSVCGWKFMALSVLAGSTPAVWTMYKNISEMGSKVKSSKRYSASLENEKTSSPLCRSRPN